MVVGFTLTVTICDATICTLTPPRIPPQYFCRGQAGAVYLFQAHHCMFRLLSVLLTIRVNEFAYFSESKIKVQPRSASKMLQLSKLCFLGFLVTGTLAGSELSFSLNAGSKCSTLIPKVRS